LNYKALKKYATKTDMWDNESGHFLMKCPFCKSTEMQIDARRNNGICHNPKCQMAKRSLSIEIIEDGCRRFL